MTQLVFAFPKSETFGRADFVVSEANAAALGWVDRWPEWPSPVLVLHGPEGAGKTHLAHLWRERAGAAFLTGMSLDETRLAKIIERGASRMAVDDADCADEAMLLHLFNACLEAGGALLLTARQAPGPWPVALADLRSRLRAAPAVGIGPPDDALLAAVLAKHFADRQLRVAAEVIAYLVRHIERSLAAARATAAVLDEAALHRNGAITIPLAHSVLNAQPVRSHRPSRDDSDAGVT
jgi:chromosomal replication initiation ATPase DnaA